MTARDWRGKRKPGVSVPGLQFTFTRITKMQQMLHPGGTQRQSSLRRVAPVSSADLVRDLARRVRYLGRGSRHWCAETFLLERDTIGRELELVADELRESGR